MEKSIWNPTQTLTWLGFDLNLTQGMVSVLVVKIEAVLNQLRALQNRHNALAKQLANVVGKIISMSIYQKSLRPAEQPTFMA